VLTVRYKIVATDYQTAIVYACHAERDDGTCRRESEQVEILSRSDLIDESTLSRLHQTVKNRLCVDVHDFVEPSLNG
jgi:hypothetical protein